MRVSYGVKKRRERIAAGECSNCGGTPRPGLKSCAACARDGVERKEEWRRLGLCIGCGQEDPFPGKKSCEGCLYKGRERLRQKIKNGLCTRCSKPSDQSEKWMCTTCSKKKFAAEIARRLKLLADGKCRCGSPLEPDRMACHSCLDKNRRKIARRRARE